MRTHLSALTYVCSHPSYVAGINKQTNYGHKYILLSQYFTILVYVILIIDFHLTLLSIITY